MEAGITNNCSSQDKESVEWPKLQNYSQEKLHYSEETYFFEADDGCKIKPEIELKEETGGFVYKTDFRGQLQLVSSHDSLNQCSTLKTNCSDEEQDRSVNSSLCTSYCSETFYEKSNSNSNADMYRISGNTKEWSTPYEGLAASVSWNDSARNQGNQYLKTICSESMEGRCYVKKEPLERDFKHRHSKICDYSSDGTPWEPQLENNSQMPKTLKNLKLSGKSVLLTQAEKKRLYRMRIKDENPSLWLTVKKKEAARKREQREKRRHILCEMQKAMELSIPTGSFDYSNQKLYLDALKQRYPELWNQLLNALPATQMRNEHIFNNRGEKSKRNNPKPAKMYKDVIEAQKKRLYRQRLKEEQPEMYERQKARNAYTRNMQRLMQRKKHSENQNGKFLSNDEENNLHYPQSMEAVNYQFAPVKSPGFVDHHNTFNPKSRLQNLHTTKTLPSPISENTVKPFYSTCDNLNIKSDPFQVCESKHSENNYIVSKRELLSSQDTGETKDASSNSLPYLTSCSTQSDILWYWSDLKSNQFGEDLLSPSPHAPWKRRTQILTKEERLQKILKERVRLKEKHRCYRMNMSPEKRMEFLKIERERLKIYRLKKKAAEAAAC